jgi:hypothetical protein
MIKIKIIKMFKNMKMVKNKKYYNKNKVNIIVNGYGN